MIALRAGAMLPPRDADYDIDDVKLFIAMKKSQPLRSHTPLRHYHTMSRHSERVVV